MNEKEVQVANMSTLEDGQMREVSVDGVPVLLARVGDKCFAVAAHCPHYGAPLVDGVLNGDRLVCPWHHACFDVTTGDLLEPPAFDSLPRFDVTIDDDGDRISIKLPENAPDRRTSAMTKREPTDLRTFVILGGGAAGYIAAQTLREDGYTGRVVIVTREDRSPYDRPNLSKDYLEGHAEPEWMPLRPDDFFAKYDLEILRRTEAADVSTVTRTITFTDGQTLRYDSLLIATGGKPRKLPFQSEGQTNVFLLRSFSDTDAIIAAAEKGKRAVVIGASFIGMEVACSLQKRGCDVTVVSPDEVPFKQVLGSEIGKLFRDVHERNGVKFKLEASVAGFDGDDRVRAVLLDGGERVDTDLVVVGVGVKPATGFLSDIELSEDGGVITDGNLRIADGVYAAGDVAHFPDPRTGELTRIEHWRTALQQGRTAAHNMAGKPTVYSGVPFFWTVQFDANLRYVGHVRDWDRIVFDGSVERHDFLAFYIKNNRILAVAGMNRDRELANWEEMIRQNRVPSPRHLSTGAADNLKNSSGSVGFSAHNLL